MSRDGPDHQFNCVIVVSAGRKREAAEMVPDAETAPEILMAGVLLSAA